MEYKMCRFVGGNCGECVDKSKCINPQAYTPGCTECFKAGKTITMNSPTCPNFEPNFLKVARIATCVASNNIFDNRGNNIARVCGSVALDPSGWFRVASENITVPVIIKNPDSLKELEDSIGIRNGLTVIYGVPLAVAVSESGTLRVSRATQPYKSENLFQAYYTLLSKLKSMDVAEQSTNPTNQPQ